MKVTRQQAEKNRERVLDVAGRQFREKGFDGIGVDAMKGAGLTHGGFYANFKSKKELAANPGKARSLSPLAACASAFPAHGSLRLSRNAGGPSALSASQFELSPHTP